MPQLVIHFEIEKGRSWILRGTSERSTKIILFSWEANRPRSKAK